MRKQLEEFMKLNWTEKAYLFEAFLTLLVVRVLTLSLSAKRLVKLLGKPSQAKVQLTSDQVPKVKLVRDAIHRIAPYTPVKTVCLQQALAGRLMLQRRRVPSQFSFGGRMDQGQLKGHAWLKAGDHWVTGKETAHLNGELLTLVNE